MRDNTLLVKPALWRCEMRNVAKLSKFVLVSGFALISTGIAPLAATAGNLDAHLRGSYAFTTARTCTNSSSPILPSTYSVGPAGVFRQASSDKGIITFNGDGTGSSVGSSTTMDISAPSGPLVTVSTFTSTFDYTVNADGTVDTITTSNPFESIFGRGAGDTGTVSGQRGRLQISHGNTMLVSAPSGTFAVETVEIHPASGGTVTRYRICVRSITAAKLPGN
jgi:hypothetical protein